ncbi:MAG TPA: NYN domain-containing protein [Patescibacteria group bacterium]
MEYQHQRVAVFVDVQNLYHSAKNLYSANVNFSQILQDAVGNRQLVRAIAYVVRAEGPKEQAFFDALEKAGFELKVKDIQTFAGGAKKADWDVGMAIDALTIAKHVDVVILMTGDGDFTPLISYLQNSEGNLVEVAAFGRSSSSRLVEWADKFLDFENNPERYLLGYRSPEKAEKPTSAETTEEAIG